MDIKEYYHNSIIKDRLQNFFSGCDWFLTAGSQYSRDPCWGDDPPVRVYDISEFDERLGDGPDVFRPIISRHGVLGVFDLEYYNTRNKELLFLPLRREMSDIPEKFGFHDLVFREYLEPVYQRISSALGDETIADMTWSGYHFLTEIKRESPVYNKLLMLGWHLRDKNAEGPLMPNNQEMAIKMAINIRCLEPQLIAAYSAIDEADIKRRVPTTIADGVVYTMFGRILEYLCHCVISDTQKEIDVPITICDSADQGISLDISQYGDPVYMRIIRSAFSSWDKHNMNGFVSDLVGEAPFLDVVRKYGKFENNNLPELFELARDYESSIEYAKNFSGKIPAAGTRIFNLALQYENSLLRRFHKDFDDVEHDPDNSTYMLAEFDERFDARARQLMAAPNPELMQPKNLKWFSEHLLLHGINSKHIGGIIAARYEAEDKGWKQKYWSKYLTRTRANFWARVYCGLDNCRINDCFSAKNNSISEKDDFKLFVSSNIC